MKRVRRAPFMIAAAVILPLLIFLGIQFAFEAREQRRAVEAEALAKTERVLVEADGALQRTLGLLDAVAATRPLAGRDLQAAYDRLQLIRRIERSWVTVRLVDVASGRVLFDLRQPLGARIGADGFDPPAGSAGAFRAFVGNVAGSGPGCPCALVHRYLGGGGAPAYLLTVAIDTRPLLRMLAQQTEQGRVGGIVDRNGNFVARTLDHRRRVATPATEYVQRAIRSGRRGIYRSTTWEGFVSYTAFSTSDLSGWSAHIAFSTGLIDPPRWRSLAAGLFAGLASLLLALVLIWFTLRQLAEGRRVQERLQEAQKMEALGQITGGIAHDFNNLLTPIVGGLGLLARKAELDPAARRLLESAPFRRPQGRQADRPAAGLLAAPEDGDRAGRPRRLVRRDPAAARAIGRAGRPYRHGCGGGGALRLHRRQPARAGSAQPRPQRPRRHAGRRHGQHRRASRAVRRGHGRMVTLEVRDTGEGMPRNVLRRATEPFFTTKDAGSGTGLGLAQVYGIVRQSGGTLSIESEPGLGTVVTISLPAASFRPRSRRPNPKAPRGSTQGTDRGSCCATTTIRCAPSSPGSSTMPASSSKASRTAAPPSRRSGPRRSACSSWISRCTA